VTFEEISCKIGAYFQAQMSLTALEILLQGHDGKLVDQLLE